MNNKAWAFTDVVLLLACFSVIAFAIYFSLPFLDATNQELNFNIGDSYQSQATTTLTGSNDTNQSFGEWLWCGIPLVSWFFDCADSSQRVYYINGSVG